MRLKFENSIFQTKYVRYEISFEIQNLLLKQSLHCQSMKWLTLDGKKFRFALTQDGWVVNSALSQARQTELNLLALWAWRYPYSYLSALCVVWCISQHGFNILLSSCQYLVHIEYLKIFKMFGVFVKMH